MKSPKMIYRMIAMMMAVLIFFSSIGVVIDVHFCNGKLISYAFYGKAKTCYELAGFENPEQAVEVDSLKDDHSQCNIGLKDCCGNETQIAKNNYEYQTSSPSLTTQDDIYPVLVNYVSNSLNLFKFKPSFTQNYSPPFIPKNFSVLFQSFLL